MSRIGAAVGELESYASLVRFSHSIFALPFALQGAWLAARGTPPLATLGWIVLACVAARTAAMGFNRIVDRDIDARNPRTRSRELPAGKLTGKSVVLLVIASSGVFVTAAAQLNPLCAKLAPLVLFVLLSYSWTKRFTWLCHAVLGLSLALAPLGAWLAVRGVIDRQAWVPTWIAAAVLTWVAGFDLIYACQDADFDRKARLHSIPARFGVARALQCSRGLHVLTVGFLVLAWWQAELGWIYAASIGLTALLLVLEHRVVRADDLSRVNLAFFTLNGWIGVGLFAGLALDLGFSG
ncbi:MAG TPA: UbiA-like polyprenyltransferase [Planctomycetota bacterium]|nr:UbiA-like polyprenyltransferase [Planctomycetota bacterium]